MTNHFGITKGRSLAGVLAALLLAACSTVPITNRRQLNLVPDAQILSMSFQQYDQFLQTHELSDDEEAVQMVKRVGQRIAQATEAYFRANNMSQALEGYQWEFHLIESDEVNAWALPGGKVVVYSGILPVAETEAGLAVIMGHEIAHAVAKHGNERMSQQLLYQMAGMTLTEAMGADQGKTSQLLMAALGLGAQVGILLPYSRLQETEADELGLIFMAMAGYDPRAAVDFWQRMASAKGAGGEPPEFLSTHPSTQARIDNLREMIPEATKYYRQS